MRLRPEMPQNAAAPAAAPATMPAIVSNKRLVVVADAEHLSRWQARKCQHLQLGLLKAELLTQFLQEYIVSCSDLKLVLCALANSPRSSVILMWYYLTESTSTCYAKYAHSESVLECVARLLRKVPNLRAIHGTCPRQAASNVLLAVLLLLNGGVRNQPGA